MKVLIVASYWHGMTGNFMKDAFLACGHTVKLVYGQYVSGNLVTDMYANLCYRVSSIKKAEQYVTNRTILKHAYEFKPELILVNCPGAVFPETLIALKRTTEAKLVCWSGDDPLKSDASPYCRQGLKYYDYHFLVDKSWYSEELKSYCPKKVYFLPYGADTVVYRPVSLSLQEQAKYGSDISHVGIMYENRRAAFEMLSNYDLGLWGTYAFNVLRYKCISGEMRSAIRGGRTPVQITNKIYCASRIVLNIQHKQFSNQINNRAFEIAASKSFQLCSFVAKDSELSAANGEIVFFKTTDELRKLIDHFLSHPEEAKKIAERGYQAVVSRHTYIHRVNELEQIVC